MKEFYDTKTNSTFTLIEGELYILNDEDEWDMLDFDDMDFSEMLDYVKIIGELTH